MAKNTGKVRKKSGNFVSPEKWEPWSYGSFCLSDGASWGKQLTILHQTCHYRKLNIWGSGKEGAPHPHAESWIRPLTAGIIFRKTIFFAPIFSIKTG